MMSKVAMDQTMKQKIETLIECIRLSGAGARGTLLSDCNVPWMEVIQTASAQKVLPLVSCAVINNPDLSCPDPIKDYLLNLLRSLSVENAIRRQRVIRLLNEIEQTGISVQVLKGYAVSQLYAFPESRESIDNDILIDAEEEKKVYDFLREKGFLIKGRRMTANDGVCEHRKYGKIEVHVSLYPEIMLDAWKSLTDVNGFICEQSYRIDSIDGAYSTLGYTDQLLFLSLHMAKHFIESGLTIRMILDIALHFAKYRNEIDVKRYWSIICDLKFETLINSVLCIAVEYCGFRIEDFPGMKLCASAQIMGVLRDLEEGGYMGVQEMKERYECGMAYNRHLLLQNKSHIQYKGYMLAWKMRSGAKNMLPAYEQLKQLYPCVNKSPYLAPAFWIYQACSYTASKLKSGVLEQEIQSDNSAIHELSKRRLELFERLGML